MIYLRARYYDPATAQFLTRDPADALTRSAYGYIDDQPLSGADPLGLSTCGKSKGLFDVVGSLIDCASKGDAGGAANTVAQGGSDIIQATPVGTGLDLASQITGDSVGICAGGDVFGGYDVTASACYMVTPSGQAGFTVSADGGGGAPFGVSGLVGLSMSNAQNLNDLRGTSTYIDGGAGEELYGAGGSASFSQNSCGKTIWQGTAGWDPSFRVPAPFSFGGGVEHTWAFG